MSGHAPQRVQPTRSASSSLRQNKPVRKLTGRSVQRRHVTPASRVIVTVQDDPDSPGTANIQIMRSVPRIGSNGGPSQSSPSRSFIDRLLASISEALVSPTPAERMQRIADQQRQIEEAARTSRRNANEVDSTH